MVKKGGCYRLISKGQVIPLTSAKQSVHAPSLDAAGATIKIGANTISATDKKITEPNTSGQIQP